MKAIFGFAGIIPAVGPYQHFDTVRRFEHQDDKEGKLFLCIHPDILAGKELSAREKWKLIHRYRRMTS